MVVVTVQTGRQKTHDDQIQKQEIFAVEDVRDKRFDDLYLHPVSDDA